MKKKKNNSKKNKDNKSNIFFTVLLIVLLIAVGLLLFTGEKNNNRSTAYAASVPREDVDPGEYPELTLGTVEEALAEANSQLSSMTEGNIQTVDGNHEDFVGRLILDHMIGNIIYWELSSPDIIVSIDGYTCEIVYYHYSDWTNGTLTQQEIEMQSELIAEQFAEIPEDSETPEIDLDEKYFITLDIEGNETTEIQRSWYLTYMRSKDNIITDDKFIICLTPNGDLSGYSKIWFMDLEDFETTYTFSKEDAEETARQYTGPGSTVHESYKYIVRPNNYWHIYENEELSFGLDPVIVWFVAVEDAEQNLCIYHIDGNENTIIGGEFIAFYYEES